MICPSKLHKNDTVAIVSTARKIREDEITSAISLLKSWGLKVVLGKTIGLEYHQFAGSDEERTTDLQNFLDDPKIKAIWCARGGYGTVRIIDKLNFAGFQKNPKWIIGYSDITVLHSELHQLGYSSIHATMPRDIPENSSASIQSLRQTLFQKDLSYDIYSIKGHVSGIGEGTLIGGNLSILYSLLGSSSAIDPKNKILFLEDLDEYLYHIDRMLINLKRNGYFDQLAGLIIGSFTDLNDNDIPFGKSVREIILDIVGETSYPIVFDFPAGHLKDNRTMIFGATLKMKVETTEARLVFSNTT
jgi:muramoyltetrapeptide carboxypeptidase